MSCSCEGEAIQRGLETLAPSFEKRTTNEATAADRLVAAMSYGAVLTAMLCAGLWAPRAALGADKDEQALDLKSGQEATFAVTIADGKVTIGPARMSKLGSAEAKDGEISVGLGPRDNKTLREDVTVVEKTPVPIDFLATGLIGGTKIDEAVVCGRLGAPSSAHIGAVSWRVRLHAFEARKDGATCE
jgi:hypothetical protein